MAGSRPRTPRWSARWPVLGPVLGGLLLGFAASGGRLHAALLGDVDGDRRVTVRDAVRLLKIISGLMPATARDQVFGDLSLGDRGSPLASGTPIAGGRPLDRSDAAGVLRVAAGLRPPREVADLVYTVAGGGESGMAPAGFRDGAGTDARFGEPYNIAGGPSGDLYVVDRCNNAIRVVTPAGEVRTLAGRRSGRPGSAAIGFEDGPGDRAQFARPEAVAVAPDETVYVADTFNNRIRRIAPDGTVTTCAGDGRRGFADGPVLEAEIDRPRAVAISPAGEVVVADSTHRIRAVGRDGRVRTLAGTGAPGFTDGPALEAQLNRPRGLAFAPNGDLYIADCHNGAVRKLTPEGFLTTVAGTGRFGAIDGDGRSAQFVAPMGIGVDGAGNVWIADWAAETVRKITPAGAVTTVAGRAYRQGLVDGPGQNARFYSPMGLWVAPDGRIWIADTDNQRIRVMEP